MAMSSNAPPGRALRNFMRADEPVDEAAIVRGVEWLDALETERATIEVAHRELDRALASLDASPLTPHARADLAQLARFVIEREF